MQAAVLDLHPVERLQGGGADPHADGRGDHVAHGERAGDVDGPAVDGAVDLELPHGGQAGDAERDGLEVVALDHGAVDGAVDGEAGVAARADDEAADHVDAVPHGDPSHAAAGAVADDHQRLVVGGVVRDLGGVDRLIGERRPQRGEAQRVGAAADLDEALGDVQVVLAGGADPQGAGEEGGSGDREHRRLERDLLVAGAAVQGQRAHLEVAVGVELGRRDVAVGDRPGGHGVVGEAVRPERGPGEEAVLPLAVVTVLEVLLAERHLHVVPTLRGDRFVRLRLIQRLVLVGHRLLRPNLRFASASPVPGRMLRSQGGRIGPALRGKQALAPRIAVARLRYSHVQGCASVEVAPQYDDSWLRPIQKCAHCRRGEQVISRRVGGHECAR